MQSCAVVENGLATNLDGKKWFNGDTLSFKPAQKEAAVICDRISNLVGTDGDGGDRLSINPSQKYGDYVDNVVERVESSAQSSVREDQGAGGQ